MPAITIEDAAQHVGEDVTFRGWLRSRRDSGKLHFLTVRDGTGDIQAIVSKKAVGDEQFAVSASLTQESSMIVSGKLRQDDRAPGGCELDVTHIEVEQIAVPFPIQPKEHGVGFLMEHRISGCARTGNMQFSVFATRSSAPAGIVSTTAASFLSIHRSLRQTLVKERRRFFKRSTSMKWLI